MTGASKSYFIAVLIMTLICEVAVAFRSSSRLVNRSFYLSRANRANPSLRVHLCNARSPHCSVTRLFSSASDESDDGRARVLFLGTPEVAASSLQAIYTKSLEPTSPYKVVGVVTQPNKRRKKRSGDILPTPVGIVAEELGIPILCPENSRDKDFLDELEASVKPDLCITAAYGQYLTKRFLALPKFGTLNIHPSLLPRWRGSSPVQRSLEAGDNPVGVSVLFTVSAMDAGPIVSQKSVEIDENEQATTLLPKLFEVGTDLLLDVMPSVVSGKITMETATQQDDELVVDAKMIDASEGRLKPESMTARECHNRIRGFSMWPGTYVYLQMGDGEPIKVKIVESRVLDETMEVTDIIKAGPKKSDGLRLICYDGSVLEVLQVQPATKKVMDHRSFANGLQGRSLRWLKDVDEDAIKLK